MMTSRRSFLVLATSAALAACDKLGAPTASNGLKFQAVDISGAGIRRNFRYKHTFAIIGRIT